MCPADVSLTLQLADFDISSEITSDITSELFSLPEFCPVFRYLQQVCTPII